VLRGWRVSLRAPTRILGVDCTGVAYVAEWRPEDVAWGCRLGEASARSFGLPAGSNVQFSLRDGVLSSVHLYGGATLPYGELRCTGELGFLQGRLSLCVLGRETHVAGIQLPAGTRLTWGEMGLTSAEIRGSTVRAAGRTWGPEYTPCGELFLWFNPDGTVDPPAPDPDHETCCD